MLPSVKMAVTIGQDAFETLQALAAKKDMSVDLLAGKVLARVAANCKPGPREKRAYSRRRMTGSAFIRASASQGRKAVMHARLEDVSLGGIRVSYPQADDAPLAITLQHSFTVHFSVAPDQPCLTMACKPCYVKREQGRAIMGSYFIDGDLYAITALNSALS